MSPPAGKSEGTNQGSKRIASTAVIGIGVSASSVMLQLLVVILMGRPLGVSGIGTYLGWFSAIQLLATVARFGCGQLVIRLLAEPVVDERALRAARLATTCAAALFGSLAAVIILASGVSAPIAISVGVSNLALTHLSMSSAFARGQRRVITAQIYTPLLSSLVMLLLILLLDPMTPDEAIALQSGSFLAAAVFAWAWNSRHPVFTTRPAFSDLSRFSGEDSITKEASRLFTTELTSMAATWLPGVMLPVFASPAAAGLFGGANRATRPLLMVQAGVNNTIGPRIAGSGTDIAVAKRFARQGALLTAVVAAPLTFLLVLGGSRLLAVLGEGFSDGAPALTILAVATFLGLASGPVNMLLSLRGYSRDSATGALLGLAILVLGLAISSTAVHAALAVAANTLVRSLFGVLMVRKRFGFWIYPQWRRSSRT